ncbi:MAG: metallophosphoesterase [Pseudomonadota bacterium]
MKLIQLTDIHLTKKGDTIAGRDPNANFERALAHALSHHPDAERLIITGDLSDWGEEEDYRLLSKIIERLEKPVELMIGNHDDRSTFLRTFPDLEGEGGFVHRTFPLTVGTGIALDTWGPKSHAGYFCEQRASWLDKTLSTLSGDAWLFMHHNPVPTGIGPMDEIMLLDHDRFADAIGSHASKIRHIFHGHCHLPLNGSLRGVPFSAPRGTNHAGWPTYGAERLLSGSDLPESYAVIMASERSTMVCMVEYGYDGEIRHEGSPAYEDWDKLTMIR